MLKVFFLIIISLSSLAVAADWNTLTPIGESMNKVVNIDSIWIQKYPIIKQLNIVDIGIPNSNTQLESNYFKAINNPFNINNEALTFILNNLHNNIDVITAAIKYVQYYQQFLFTSNHNNLLPYYKQVRIADSCIVILKIKDHLEVNLIDQQLLAIINSNTEIKKLYTEHYNAVITSWPSYGYDFWGAKDLCLSGVY